MKKKIISIAFIAAITVAAAWNFSRSSKAEIDLSDIALANVEALASEENDDGTGKLCYKSITAGESLLILYCDTCTYLPGKEAAFSGTGKCN
jgi:hypothetical protein